MPKLTLDYKDYNIMKVTRIILFVLFIILLLPVAILLTFLLISLVSQSWNPLLSDSLIDIVFILNLFFLCASLLFFKKHRRTASTIAFFVFAGCQLFVLFSGSILIPASQGNWSALILMIAMILSLLLAIFFCVMLFGKPLPHGFCYLGFIFVLLYLAFLLLSAITGTPANSPALLTNIIYNLAHILPYFVFSYFYMMSFNKAFLQYFIQQNFKSVLQNSTIIFS